jgi:phage shock protein PspC (stress-responsive transcriptional regulator)
MSLPDELTKLEQMRDRGSLSSEEFARAKARLLGEPATGKIADINGFRRSSTDRWIGGVCGGLAAMSNMPSWAWRILFVLTALLHGVGILVYLVLWIFVPLQTMPRQPAREEPKPI